MSSDFFVTYLPDRSEGRWSPLAARQAAFVVAHLTA
jgi:hypothetical protein